MSTTKRADAVGASDTSATQEQGAQPLADPCKLAMVQKGGGVGEICGCSPEAVPESRAPAANGLEGTNATAGTARPVPRRSIDGPESTLVAQRTRSMRARRIRFLPGSRTLSKAALFSRTQLPEGPFTVTVVA